MNPLTRRHKYYKISLLFIYVIVLLKTAWITDDAYITFRSIENFIHGYGLVHNVGERVQTFTHPLWFFILSGANYIFQKVLLLDYWSQMYFTDIFISIILSITTVLLIALLIAKSSLGAILALIILISSRAFMDYSTSGLENPLTHLLFAFFLYVLFEDRWPKLNKILMLSFIAGLGILNRLDTFLLYLPPLLFEISKSKQKIRNMFFIMLGFTPIILWELFSLFYYGTFFPNTAYAKLNTGISRTALLKQGLLYFSDSFLMDPLTLLSVLGVVIFILYKKQRKLMPIVGSILLYMAYILYIGGDFMSGRFFSSLVLATAVILSQISYKEKHTAYGILIVLALVLGLLNNTAPLRAPLNYGGGNVRNYINHSGISDERAYYFRRLGLLSLERENEIPGSRYSGKDWIYNAEKRSVEIIGPMGVDGYHLGPNVHVIDWNSLADPLMSRLPLIDTFQWRIGHFRHQIPEGYLETLSSGVNKIHDKSVAKYYDKLKFIVRGDLFNPDRILEIIKFNLGKYDYLIDSYSFSRINLVI